MVRQLLLSMLSIGRAEDIFPSHFESSTECYQVVMLVVLLRTNRGVCQFCLLCSLAVFADGPSLHNHHPLPSLKRSGRVFVSNTSKK